MEITVRKSDLVKELQLVQGIVERKNSIPILSNVLAEAKGGEVRIAATDLDVSLRCGCAAEVKAEGAITLGAKKLYEIVRSLPESDVRIKVLPDSWAHHRVRARELQDGGTAEGGLPVPARGQGGQGRGAPGGDAARPHRPDGVRHHRGGRPLLPRRRAPRARQGRRVHGGHRRAPALLRAPQGRAQGDGDPARPRPPQGHPGAGPPAGDEDTATFQQVENHLVFTVGDAGARVQDHRGPVPGLREGHRPHRRQGGGAGARSAGHRHPPREPAVLGAQPRRPPDPRGGQARPLGVVAGPGRGQGVAHRGIPGAGRGDRVQRPVPARLPRRRAAARRCPSSSRTTRARACSVPRAARARPTTATWSCRCGSRSRPSPVWVERVEIGDVRNLRDVRLEPRSGAERLPGP